MSLSHVDANKLRPAPTYFDHVEGALGAWAKIRSFGRPAPCGIIPILAAMIEKLVDEKLGGFAPIPLTTQELVPGLNQISAGLANFRPGAKYLFSNVALQVIAKDQLKVYCGQISPFFQEPVDCSTLAKPGQIAQLGAECDMSSWRDIGKDYSKGDGYAAEVPTTITNHTNVEMASIGPEKEWGILRCGGRLLRQCGNSSGAPPAISREKLISWAVM